ncbi:MAG TPA: carboxylating nicotinate-nucleotide diphosphorylase [Streptosporangiaceae bacterium]|jgi:nicotinate-nucleotide pyrophosphorylase (carboxylating)|nr:carboxylating nicotinate-nucleotide diphosphorylase [Streptosporangiaceae bacterium]
MLRRPTRAALRAAGLDPGEVGRLARAAIAEDLRYGPDVTTAAIIPAETAAAAEVVARAGGVVAGLPVAAAVVEAAAAVLGPAGGGPGPAGGGRLEALAADGDRVAPGDVLARVTGPLRVILGAERTLLNFLTHLSGIATATRAWVDAVEGTGCQVRDTRKTLPGLRALQKYAVRCGGGVNHRMGLGDAALVKDNHVAAAGGIAAALRAVRAAAPGVPAEVECDTPDQVREALAAGATLILLDNMGLDDLRSAVRLARAHPGVRLEASGGLRLAGARAVAQTGVHYLAVGALTHSSPALDLALDLAAGRITA